MNPPVINNFQCPAIDYADKAHAILRDAMNRYGSTLSPDHDRCLQHLVYSYAMMSAGHNSKRVAWPLSVGSGKTVSIAAFAAANLTRSKPASIMVAQNTIESLCKLKRLMIDFGIPEDHIGLLHQKRYSEDKVEDAKTLQESAAGFASEKSIDERTADQYPILLLSHKMLKSRQDIFRFNQYDNRERDIVIWDESLLKATGRTLNLSTVNVCLAAAKASLEERTTKSAQPVLDWLAFAQAELKAEVEEQKTDGRPPKLVELPEKTDHEREALEVELRGLLKGRREDFLVLAEFLSLTAEPLRVINVQQQAVIKYDLVIPDSLKRIVVLDASYNIRELVSKYDDEIDLVDAFVDIKSFEGVTANRLTHHGGRNSIDPALRQTGSKLIKAIVERVKSYPEDKGVLVFTYMLKKNERKNQRTRSHAELIQRALVQAGIDIDATLPNGKPRFVWLHWGQELGLSDFSYCERVMAVGVYRKSEATLAMELVGQRNDLSAPEAGDSLSIRKVQHSEIFHALYQAMGRGHCRVTRDGKAGHMQLDWIGVEQFPSEYWTEATPNIQIGEWESKYINDQQKAQERAQAMRKYLRGLPESVDYVSTRTLNAACDLTGLHPTSLSNARKELVKSLKGWLYSTERRGYYRFG